MPPGCYGAQRRGPQPSKGGTAGEGTVTFYLEIGLIQILSFPVPQFSPPSNGGNSPLPGRGEGFRTNRSWQGSRWKTGHGGWLDLLLMNEGPDQFMSHPNEPR